jgi:hypothetical protein
MFEPAASAAAWVTLCAVALVGSFGYLALLTILSWPGAAIRFFGTQSRAALWFPDVMAFGIGVVLCLGAVLFALTVWNRWAGRVLVCPRGFVHARRRPEAFRYDDIVRVVQDNPWTTPGPTDHRPSIVPRTTFLVQLKDGREFYFGPDTLRGHLRFAYLLHAQAQARGIPWEVRA